MLSFLIMYYKFVCLGLFLGTVSGLQAQNPDAVPVPDLRTTIGDYVVGAFFSQRGAGSAILSGPCAVTPDGDEAITEEILAPDPGSFKSLHEAFNHLSRVNQHIAWSRQKDGLVGVRDERATGEILRLPIKQFELKDAVTLQDAVNKLLLVPEVKYYLDQHHLESPTVYSSPYMWGEKIIQKLSESPTAPKYSQTFSNVTLEEALNGIVRVFPGVWEYRECPGRITITSDPTRVRRTGEINPFPKLVPAVPGG